MAHRHIFAQLFHERLRRQNIQHDMLRMKPLSYINELESAVSHSSVSGLPCLESVAPSYSFQNLLIFGTKPTVGATVGQSPRQGCAPFPTPQCLELSRSEAPSLIFLMPGLCWAMQICWLSITGNVDLIDICFCTYAGAFPVQFFHVPVFISSFLFFVSNPSHCCCAVWVWLSTHALTSTWI